MSSAGNPERFILWWTMVEAEYLLADGAPPPDDTPVLYFMGSGASGGVSAGDIRALIKLLPSTKPE
jgi:hypothetical protein